MSIPYPDNPEHTDNLTSISLLEAQGFEGPDASLAHSLFEYKMAWRTFDDQLLFVHANPHYPQLSEADSPDQQRYDRTTIRQNTDPCKEWKWVKWDDLAELFDWSEDWATALPLQYIVYDLVGYHGVENVFGSSYWEGFTISDS